MADAARTGPGRVRSAPASGTPAGALPPGHATEYLMGVVPVPGVPGATAEIHPERELAINPGAASPGLQGVPARDVRTVAEALAAKAPHSQEIDRLTAPVRAVPREAIVH